METGEDTSGKLLHSLRPIQLRPSLIQAMPSIASPVTTVGSANFVPGTTIPGWALCWNLILPAEIIHSHPWPLSDDPLSIPDILLTPSPSSDLTLWTPIISENSALSLNLVVQKSQSVPPVFSECHIHGYLQHLCQLH